jgi:hypothetical protein
MRLAGSILALACFTAATAIAAAPPAPPPPPIPAGPLTITVYDQENFKGRAVKITTATPNLAALQLEDKVASFEVAGAGDWVLCENRNYGGRCVRVQAKAGDLRIIQLFARVSSLYPVPAPIAPAAPAAQK